MAGNEQFLSVKLITFNHVEYISMAIEGVLSQKTGFPLEIVIGDDCSTDGTAGVIESYRAKYPDLIRVMPNDKNIGGKRNNLRTLAACRGKYVAHLDGDDYWTDPEKLKKQVDVLESDDRIAICFHNMEVRNEDPNMPSNMYCWFRDGRQLFTKLDLAKRNFIPNSSTVIRNGLITEFPEWCMDLPIGDWPTYLLNARHGDIYYIPQIMGVYRKHSGGQWTAMNGSQGTRNSIAVLDAFIANVKDDPQFVKCLKKTRRGLIDNLKLQVSGDKSWKTRILEYLIWRLERLK